MKKGTGERRSMLIDNSNCKKMRSNSFDVDVSSVFNFIQLTFVFSELMYLKTSRAELSKRKQRIQIQAKHTKQT